MNRYYDHFYKITKFAFHQANVYLFKINNRNTRKSDVIDVVLVSLLLTLNIFRTFSVNR